MSCTAPLAATDGPHSFVASASDQAQNVRIERFSFTWDGTAPTATLEYGPIEGTAIASNSPRFTFTASDATSAITRRCGVDGVLEACSTTTSHQLVGLRDGRHSFTLRVSDEAGNVTTRDRTFTVDASSPQVQLTGRLTEGERSAQTTQEFVSTVDGAVEVKCSLDSAIAFRECSGRGRDTLSGLGDGPHVFRVRARDAADSATVIARTFVIDSSRPQTAIDSGPTDGSSIASDEVSFAFSADAAGSTFQQAATRRTALPRLRNRHPRQLLKESSRCSPARAEGARSHPRARRRPASSGPWSRSRRCPAPPTRRPCRSPTAS